jgi:plasmid stabilization system protein ParE
MAPAYDVSAEAQDDLFEIWRRIAEDSVDLANRIDGEFHRLFASLARVPGQGHARKEAPASPGPLLSPVFLPGGLSAGRATAPHPGGAARPA